MREGKDFKAAKKRPLLPLVLVQLATCRMSFAWAKRKKTLLEALCRRNRAGSNRFAFSGLLGRERFQSDWKIVSNAKTIRKRIVVVPGRENRCDPEESK